MIEESCYTKELQEFANKHKINLPKDARFIISRDDDGKIKSIVGLRIVIMIEPLISENPLHANKTYNYTEEKLKEAGFPIVRGITDKKNEKLFNKKGFNRIFNDKIIIEKLLK